MLAIPGSANAAFGAGGCSQYSLSCGSPPPGADGGTPSVPAGVPSAPAGSQAGPASIAPILPGASGDMGSAAGNGAVGPTARAQLSAAGHLPFTGYPLVPLIEVLLAMLAAAVAIRLVIEVRQRRGGSVR
jgi:hypothetical protein